MTPQKNLTQSTQEGSQRTQDSSQPIRNDEQEIDRGKLLFFLNPGGRPCQLQARIINENKADIEKYVRIHYITTDDSANRSLFYQYGVRGLPTVIVLNSDHSIAHRFPPGIHRSPQLLKNLQTVK